ncbi:penicillin-binding protein activator [Thiocapsa imhoffii]|uniref:Penicillin-binding protein activator n=1 Tax=Thiocapsa imhoffii TaxID=382777 RepID=A0A9X0WFT0_9GAMM|nr:penicillin-binding protein activator [Thiocapsa imhoffii]MBK1643357.1 penicillin-binding protein activator [Thiocapsa imhoffii]
MLKNRVHRRRLSSSIAWSIASILAMLAGCAVVPTHDTGQLLASVPSDALASAERLAAQGQADAAVAAYLQLAENAVPPAREQLRLQAARTALSTGNTQTAQQTIAQIERTGLTPGQREQMLLLEADLALLDGRPHDAIARLQAMQPRALPTDLKIQRLGTLAAAQRLAQQPVAAADSLIALDRLLGDESARLLNQVSLLSTLSALSADELEHLARTGRGPIRGWAELAQLARTAGADPVEFEQRFRAQSAARLARPGLARAYVEMLSGGYAAGDRVAVLLPSSGRFAGAANAIKEGIEAASRADRTGQRPRLEFIDSSDAARVRALYSEAISGGATQVIGPLQKVSVDALADGPALAVPTLALNQTTSDRQPPKNLFQFALSPENEAADAATKAAAMDLKHAAILYPEGPWGERLAHAFRDQWRRLGGTVTAQIRYDPTASTHPNAIAELLDTANTEIVFLVATNELAHKLFPQIRLASSQITVISTSHVYSGVFDAGQDQALAGLYFVDVPWMLDDSAEDTLSRRRLNGDSFTVADPLARLSAMGIDAYRIAPRLPALAQSAGSYYPGQTGGLSLDALGRVQRQLALGRFSTSGVSAVSAAAH